MPIRPEWWAVAAAAATALGWAIVAARVRHGVGARTRWAWLALPAFPFVLLVDDYRVRVIFRAAGGAFDGVRVVALVVTTCGFVSIVLAPARWGRPAGSLASLLGLAVLASVAGFAAAFLAIR